MIKLYQFDRALGLPNMSPFCMKVETYLRLNKLDYEIVPTANPAKAPKGKLPYIVDGGHMIPDSYFILEYLKKTYGDPMGEGLSDLDRAQHHVIARMLDEHLYFAVLHQRWTLPENARMIRDTFFGGMPGILKNIVFAIVQRSVSKSLYSEGMGRHSREEIERLAIQDIEALAIMLCDKAYFGGDRPREIDCTTWSFIANIVEPPIEGDLKEAARSKLNLIAYNKRMAQLAFLDMFGEPA